MDHKIHRPSASAQDSGADPSLVIGKGFRALDAYCSANEYKGWDPYDGLNSMLFARMPFNGSRWARIAWIQCCKRSPINFRQVIGVNKSCNAKGLALFAAGLLMQDRIAEASTFLDRLVQLRSPNRRLYCWGYDFPWEARAFSVPKNKPNIVTTVFVANSFLEGFERTGNQRWLQAAVSACHFILDELILEEDTETLCFGYIPGESARVHNANLLGAALLSKVAMQTGEEQMLEKARKSVTYTMRTLNDNGYWRYGERGHHRFVDNFHTGYNLVAMLDWMEMSGENKWRDATMTALDAYERTFWCEDGCPKYYQGSLYPVDIHCSAQGIVTFLRYRKIRPNSVEKATQIACWAISNMQHDSGYFYYQKWRTYTNKIPYIRWSQAWMYYAMAMYLSVSNK